MHTAQFSSFLNSRYQPLAAVSETRRAFLRGKTWTLRDQCSLRGVANDLTAVSRRKKGEIVDVVATEVSLLTLSSHGNCVLRSFSDLSQTFSQTPSHEQVLYIANNEDYLYLISLNPKSAFLTFSRARVGDLSLDFREEIMRECRVTAEQVLGLDKTTGELAVRMSDRVEVWILQEGKIKRSVDLPKGVSRVCYDSGAIAFSEVSTSDVLIHVVPSSNRPTRLTLKNAQEIVLLDLLSDFVLFQLPGSLIQAVNFCTGMRVECPKGARKLVTMRGCEPLLVDESGCLVRLADLTQKRMVEVGNRDLQWSDALQVFLLYGNERNSVEILDFDAGEVFSCLQLKRGDVVSFCSVSESTLEVILVTQKGRLEVWQ